MQFALFYPPLIAWAVVSLCLLVSPLQAQDLHITLLNGDCDGDNEVTLSDFGIVVSAMGSVPGDPNWDPRADLDGDGEVTLFDFGIVVRNFGQVGAEPFDPTLPRLPAPSEGYALQGSVELQDWVGAPQPVRIEALREDDPDQIVYWIEVQSGEPFTLHLPRSGLWWVKVSGTQQSQARHLRGQSAAKRFYLPGDPIQASFITPREGEAFADAALEDAPIVVSVYAQDYDDVFFQSADGSRTLSNRERTTYAFDFQWSTPSLLFQWEIVSGGGSIAPIGPYAPSALYFPPVLGPDEQERSVTLRCTVTDSALSAFLSLDVFRLDLPISITRSFKIVKRPTVHVTVVAVDQQGNQVSSTPIPSGASTSRLRFTANKRGREWKLESVTLTTPWGTQTVQNPDPQRQASVSFTTQTIAPSEPHRRFQFGASAVFSMTLPPPVGRIERQDEKTGERLLGFDMTDRLEYNEAIDNTRGRFIVKDAQGNWLRIEPHPVPNWFHNREGHWGDVIARLKDSYTYGGISYPIVHWIENDDVRNRDGVYLLAFMDWSGEFADVPGGPQQFAERYRGRIYLTKRLFTHPEEARGHRYGLVVDGIDSIARAVAHEFFHREQFLEAWGGFTNAHIGSPPHFWPYNPQSGYDDDGDWLRNDYEDRMARVYWTSPNDAYAVLKWWTGKQAVSGFYAYYNDFEMCASLWGEWDHYRVGSLDAQDWSVGGRQDY